MSEENPPAASGAWEGVAHEAQAWNKSVGGPYFPMNHNPYAGMRMCCLTPPGGEHYVQCPKWEPPLTVEELRVLRQTILKGVESQ